jgi:hypothetical protein
LTPSIEIALSDAISGHPAFMSMSLLGTSKYIVAYTAFAKFFVRVDTTFPAIFACTSIVAVVPEGFGHIGRIKLENGVLGI